MGSPLRRFRGWQSTVSGRHRALLFAAAAAASQHASRTAGSSPHSAAASRAAQSAWVSLRLTSTAMALQTRAAPSAIVAQSVAAELPHNS